MTDDDLVALLRRDFDALLLDVGATLVAEATAGTAVSDLRVLPLPGVVEQLRRLAGGIRIAAVTNTAIMSADDVRALLTPVGIGEHLEYIVTSADVGTAKPDPAIINVALDLLGVPAQRALVVGDAATDGEAAVAAGASFVATDRGFSDALLRAVTVRGDPFGCAVDRVPTLDTAASDRARDRLAQLTKPAHSLGQLERIAEQLAAITGRCPPPIPRSPAVAVFAADHGVATSGVTPWPQQITAAMVRNFANGGAAINAIARQVGATVHIVDVGVNADLSDVAAVRHHKVRPGTDDLSVGAAMTSVETIRALNIGARIADDLVTEGHDLLVTGDMGIGNTTPSAALIAAFTGLDAAKVTGRGTGIDDVMLTHKTAVVATAVERVHGYLDPISILSDIGGLEIAALAGFIVGGVRHRIPVVVDGVIALAALIVADALVPGIAAHVIAGHRSTEPGASAALEHMGLEPVLDLGMRLGEGTGACLAIPVVQCAARILTEMATLDTLTTSA